MSCTAVLLVALLFYGSPSVSLSVSAGSRVVPNQDIIASLRGLDIKALCSDVDGTLLNSKHTLSDETVNAITRVKNEKAAPPFFLCTGRSRRSMSLATGHRLTSIWSENCDYAKIPGVFQQGLMVFDESRLIYERSLSADSADVIDLVVDFCRAEGLTLIAYCGDEIYTDFMTEQCSSITIYHEPLPQVHKPGIAQLHKLGVTTHKLILLDDQSILQQVRPKLAALVGDKATLTSAVPGMLEVLPPKCNKGQGVQQLLRHYGVKSRDHVIAFGDGENDIEFLSEDVVSHGIAVANASPKLQAVARFVSDKSNDDNCVAEILLSLNFLSAHD